MIELEERVREIWDGVGKTNESHTRERTMEAGLVGTASLLSADPPWATIRFETTKTYLRSVQLRRRTLW